jgi:hypothetical protein
VTKITIEIESGETGPTITTSRVPNQASQGGNTPAATGANPPPEVLAQAAAVGAINAGPAPSITDVGETFSPISSSVGGAVAASSRDVASGGAAPQ